MLLKDSKKKKIYSKLEARLYYSPPLVLLFSVRSLRISYSPLCMLTALSCCLEKKEVASYQEPLVVW